MFSLKQMASTSEDWVSTSAEGGDEQTRHLAERLGIPNARTGTIEALNIAMEEHVKNTSTIVPFTVFWLGRPLSTEVYANRDKTVSALQVSGVTFGSTVNDGKNQTVATFGFTELQSEEELKKFMQTCKGKPVHIVDTVRDQPKATLVPRYMKLTEDESFQDHIKQFLKLRTFKSPWGAINLW